MSTFDFSSIMTKTDFQAAAPDTSAPVEDLAATHQRHIERIQTRVTRFFSEGRSRSKLRINIAGLTEQEKADLIAQIEAKGYGCVEQGLKMVIE